MNSLLTILAQYKIDISPLPNVAAGDDKFAMLLTIAFSIIGAFSVLFITIGGFRYINSQGDPQAAARAKGTIMYSLVGLLVSITAVSLVTFFLGRL